MLLYVLICSDLGRLTFVMWDFGHVRWNILFESSILGFFFGDWLQFLDYYVGKSCIFINGDATTNHGQLFRALNLVVCWDLPTIVVCQKNPCKFAFDLLFICMV